MPSAPSNSISKCCDSRAVQETKVVDITQQLCSSFRQLVKAATMIRLLSLPNFALKAQEKKRLRCLL